MNERRTFVKLGLLAVLSWATAPQPAAASAPFIRVTRSPGCDCCSAWAEHLRENAFVVEVSEDPQINRLKARLGVPRELSSCHTGEVEGYVIEGHVPAGAIKRLLNERPLVRGLAVPGMPVGSPGMEIEGQAPDTYNVIAFGEQGQSTFARYEGAKEISR